MKSTEALPIIRALANGVDPETGDVFPSDSPYQRASIVRAMYVAAEALEKAERVEKRRALQPEKARQPWSEDEDRRLLTGFDSGRALSELAEAHQRTQAGVRGRLVKYGRLAA